MNIEIKSPDIGNDELEIIDILVKEGDVIKKEQSLIIVEGDKASIEIPSPSNGIVKEIKVNVGEKISTGSLIMIFESNEEEENNVVEKKEISLLKKQKKTSSENSSKKKYKIQLESPFKKRDNEEYVVHATPLIRRLARKLDIDLNKVKGTGRKGRILREDIQNYQKENFNQQKKESQTEKTIHDFLLEITSSSSRSKIDFSKFGEVEILKLSRIQKISGTNLSRNWITIPHVTHFDEVDITDLEAFRKKQNTKFEKQNLDIKSTPVVFAIKAVATALKKMPRFNSSLSEDGQFLTIRKYINIGIAVDTSVGLVVPVLKNVNNKGIVDLSKELMNIAKKAKNGKLTEEEMQGGCFTISSIGKLGTTYFSPIINAPEVAILGISKSKIKPIWNGKKFSPRTILPISLSFDHRVIDGADGARFITLIKEMLTDIRCLIM